MKKEYVKKIKDKREWQFYPLWRNPVAFELWKVADEFRREYSSRIARKRDRYYTGFDYLLWEFIVAVEEYENDLSDKSSEYELQLQEFLIYLFKKCVGFYSTKDLNNQDIKDKILRL